MRYIKDGKDEAVLFDSVADATRHLRSVCDDAPNASTAYWTKSRAKTAGWLGAPPDLCDRVSVLPEAEQPHAWADVLAAGMLERGAEVYRQTLRTHRTTLRLPTMPEVRRRQVWGNAGDELSQDRLREGRYETMFRAARRRVVVGAMPRVRLVVPVGGSSAMQAEQIAWRGVAASVLYDLLLGAGYQVELWAAQAVAGPRTRGLVAVPIARAGQPMPKDAAGAILAGNGGFRVFLGPLVAWIRWPGGQLPHGYGGALPIEQVPGLLRAAGWIGTHEKTLIVPENVLNAGQARAWIMEQADELLAIARSAAV